MRGLSACLALLFAVIFVGSPSIVCAQTASSAPAALSSSTDAPTPAPAEAPAHEPAPVQALGLGATFQHHARHHPAINAFAESSKTSEVVRISLILLLMTLIPAIAICMTPFIRIIVVLSMIRHAFGMPETPPNQVLISLAIFLTAFAMMPTLSAVNANALQPFLNGTISVKQALDQGSGPMREFMLRQVHDRDIKSVYQMAKEPLPAKAADVDLMKLTPAFMLNELRVSFNIGFVIFLPFLLIDLVVSSILLSLGMLMVPPSTISLPIKVLMFVLVDGWSLVLTGVIGSIK